MNGELSYEHSRRNHTDIE